MRLRFAITRHVTIVLGIVMFSAKLVDSTCARAEPVIPDFLPSNFVPGAPIDNPFYPLVPGTVFRYRANVIDQETGDTELREFEDTVTFDTAVIAGVTARVVRAKAFTDGVLIEDTFDHFAQDKFGNVWYMGEETTEFLYDDEGHLTGTEKTGSWTASVNGAQPGFIMLADPTVGFSYFQEHAPADEALDQAEIVSINEIVNTPAGAFSEVLKTEEFTELEPGIVENKLYARGVGQVVIEEDLNARGQAQTIIPLVSVTTTAIPLPPAAWAGFATMLFVLLPRMRARLHPI